MIAWLRHGATVVVTACVCAVAFAAASRASAAPQARHAAPRATHLRMPPWRFGPFPRRLEHAARALFHVRPGPSRTAAPRTPLIIGGTNANQGTYGFMATIIYYDSQGNPQFWCSGTLVSSNVVLTAGHCGADETTGVPNLASGYRVITNAVDWTDTNNRVVSDVNQVVVDPNFDPSTLYGDASMLVLSAPVTDPTIPLWASGQFSPGIPAVIAGWGKTYPTQTGITDVLEWAPTVLQNVTYCANQAAGISYAYDSGSELCAVDAPYYDTATCNGDSGGPLLAEDSQSVWIEIGITSGGATDCPTNSADFFTAILPIESWIESEISAATPPPPPPPPPPPTTTTTTTAPPATTTTAPTTTTPAPVAKPTLERMTLSAARSYARRVLTGVFRSRYTAGNSKLLSCSRVSPSRFNCGANFSFTPNDYYGNVVVYYVFGINSKLEWTDHYTLHWVNDYCYFHSGHRRECKVGTRRGAF